MASSDKSKSWFVSNGFKEVNNRPGQFNVSWKKSQVEKILIDISKGGIYKGGSGSGNFGHEGRPGEVGGSGGGGGGSISSKLQETGSGYYNLQGNELSIYEAVREGKTNPLSGEVGDRFYTEVLGNDKKDYVSVKQILSEHGSGDEVQVKADTKIIELIYQDSPEGKVLRDISRTETSLLRAYSEKRKEEGESLTLYRKGEIGTDKIESWSTSSKGAWMGNIGHLTPDKEYNVDDMLKEGYISIGGIGRMMGAPGESEITMIRLSHSISKILIDISKGEVKTEGVEE